MKFVNVVIWLALVLVVSCSSPEEKAEKKLNERGVPMLVSAYMDQVKEGNVENVQLLLTAGMSVDSVDENGDAALHIAAKAGQAQVVDLLLSAGADKDIRDSNGNTPLIRAVMAGKIETAVKLAGAGVNTQAVNELGSSALAVALENKNWPMVIALGNGGVNLDVVVEDGRTMLLDSIINKKGKERSLALVEAGADINKKDNGGQTPFMAAVLQNQPDMVGLMIEKGADVNTPLFDNGSTVALWKAIEAKSPELVRVLIAGGANANNCRNQETNDSCLHRAVILQQKEIVGMLIKAGADVNVQNIFHETPLYMATVNPRGKNLEIADMMVEGGAKLTTIVTENGRTLLHVAVLQSDRLSDSLAFLLEKGVDANVYDNEGQTPLTLAVMNNKLDAVDVLIKSGADLSYPAMNGKKPLAIAEELDYYKIASRLRVAGAKK